VVHGKERVHRTLQQRGLEMAGDDNGGPFSEVNVLGMEKRLRDQVKHEGYRK